MCTDSPFGGGSSQLLEVGVLSEFGQRVRELVEFSSRKLNFKRMVITLSMIRDRAHSKLELGRIKRNVCSNPMFSILRPLEVWV